MSATSTQTESQTESQPAHEDPRRLWLRYDEAVEWFFVVTGRRLARKTLIDYACRGFFETSPFFRDAPVSRVSFYNWMRTGGKRSEEAIKAAAARRAGKRKKREESNAS